MILIRILYNFDCQKSDGLVSDGRGGHKDTDDFATEQNRSQKKKLFEEILSRKNKSCLINIVRYNLDTLLPSE